MGAWRRLRTTAGMRLPLSLCLAGALLLALAGPAHATLISWWPLDGDATAAVGTSGTLVNAPTATTDRFGNAARALAFASTSGTSGSYVSVAGGGGLNGLGTGTISMWVRWAGTQDAGNSNFGHVLARQSNTVFSNNVIGINNADPASGRLTWQPYSAAAPVITGTTAAGNSTWRHVLVTFTSGSHALYLDGASQGTSATAGTMNNNPAIPLTIGAWIGDGQGYSTSSIDDVAVWDNVLAANQITALRNGVAPNSLPAAGNAVKLWNVAGPAPWETATNWNPSGVPGATDDAYVNNAGTAQVTATTGTANPASLAIGGAAAGTVQLNGGTLAPASLTVSGSGTLSLGGGTLSATSMHMNGGKLLANAAGLSTSQAIVLDSGGGIVDTQANTLTLSGALSGSGALTKNGSGTLVLSVASSYTGPTTVNAGTLQLTNSSALGNSPGVTLVPATVSGGIGTQLELRNNITVSGTTLTLNSNIAGANSYRTAIRSSSGSNTWNGGVTLNGNGLDQFYADGGNLTINGDINAGGGGFTGTLFVRGGSGTGTINGSINAPNGALAKTDGSTWVVGAAGKSYVWGNTGVYVGTLRMGIANVLPSTTIVTMGQNDANNATLDLNGKSQTIAGLAFSSTGGTKAVSSTAAATLTVNNSAAYNYGGVLGGAGLALTKQGAGSLTLGGSAANTHGGLTTVSNGSLILAKTSGNAIGGSVLINGGTLQWNDDAQVADGAVVTMTSGTINVNYAGYTDSINSLDLQGGTLTTGSPAGQLNVTKNANDALKIRGGITVPISLALDNASGGGLTFDAIADGTAVLSGGLTLAHSNKTFVINDGAAAEDMVISGGIGEYVVGTNRGFTKTGAGTLTLSGANTYAGTTTVSAGALRIASATALGGTANGTSVASGAALEILGDTTTAAEPVTLNGGGGGGGGALRSLSGTNTFAGPITLGSATRINSDGGTLTLNSATPIDESYALTFGGAGDIAVSTPLQTGTAGLTKDGAGTLTFAAANTYTGATTVNGGTLLVNGSITSDVTVVNGLLGGLGAILGGVDVQAAGIISAGNSPGHLFVDGDYTQSGTMRAEIAGTGQGTTYDWIEVDGAASLGGTINVDLLGGFIPAPGSFFDVLTATGGLTGVGSVTFDYGDAQGGPAWWVFVVTLPDGGQALRLQASPEPSTLTLLALGGLALLRRRRR